MDHGRVAAGRLVVFVCTAQVLVQIGAFFWPALLPQLSTQWNLSNSEAGWITASFYGAYILGVPILVTLTDRPLHQEASHRTESQEAPWLRTG
jgi:MFS family permease